MPPAGITSPEPGKGTRRQVANLKAQGLGLFVRSLKGRLDCLQNFALDFELSLSPALASDVEKHISAPGILVSDFLAAADAPGCGLSESPSNFDTSILGRELGSEWCRRCWGRRGVGVPPAGITSPKPGRGGRRVAVIRVAHGLGLFVRCPRVGLDCFWNFALDFGLSLLPACTSEVRVWVRA